MKKTLFFTAAVMLLSTPVFAQAVPGSGGGGVARQGGEIGTTRRSGSAAPATIPGTRMAVPMRGNKKMMRQKRSSKKIMRSRGMSRGM